MNEAGRAWLTDHGVMASQEMRRLATATTADLFLIDDLVLRKDAQALAIDGEEQRMVDV